MCTSPPGLNEFSHAHLRPLKLMVNGTVLFGYYYRWEFSSCAFLSFFFLKSSQWAVNLLDTHRIPPHGTAWHWCVREQQIAEHACAQSVLWVYIHCMCMSPHVNTCLYVFHHVKHCMSCAETDHMQLTDLYEEHDLRLEVVFDIALIPTDIESCFHPTQSYVSTLSPLPQSVWQIMQPELWSVFAHFHIPSYSPGGMTTTKVHSEGKNCNSECDLLVLGKATADGVGGSEWRGENSEMSSRQWKSLGHFVHFNI